VIRTRITLEVYLPGVEEKEQVMAALRAGEVHLLRGERFEVVHASHIHEPEEKK
jgi:hypothetical protein